MPDDPYSLVDLARLAGVTPRTVRYYVAQGLLPSPEAAGPATRYTEAHLARLRLIRRWQRDHLPLAEIRARLLGLTDDEILAASAPTVAQPAEQPAALDFVHELMAQTGVTPSLGSHAIREAQPAPYRTSLLKRIEVAPPAPPAAAPLPSGGPPGSLPAPGTSTDTASKPEAARSAQPDRSTWERLVITPDVELHVRRPLDRRTNRRIDQLERIARELLADDAW